MDWPTFEQEVRSLAKTIDYTPEVLVGVARSGLVPAVLLAKLLKIEEVHAVQSHRVGTKRVVSAAVLGGMKGKQVLLVEDMLESGSSLRAAKEFLEHEGATVRTACLYTLPTTEVVPDYFLREVPEVIAFPWQID